MVGSKQSWTWVCDLLVASRSWFGSNLIFFDTIPQFLVAGLRTEVFGLVSLPFPSLIDEYLTNESFFSSAKWFAECYKGTSYQPVKLSAMIMAMALESLLVQDKQVVGYRGPRCKS